MSEESMIIEAEPEETQDVNIRDLKYEEKLKFANIIAKPMASKKLCKKIVKLLKMASVEKGQVAFGLKKVQTTIERGGTGIVILAGDVTPIDVYCHMPTWCEAKEIPYVYVPTKYDIGDGLSMKSCIIAIIKEGESYKQSYDEIRDKIKYLPFTLI